MKLAVTVWNGRVAPVFDVAERCLLIGAESPDREMISLPSEFGADRAECLRAHGVTTLVCGAISTEYEESVIGKGIEVVSFTAGPVDEVIRAWQEKRLIHTGFSMPGCGCPRRRCRRRGNHSKNNLNL